jgi:hypothetical protein
MDAWFVVCSIVQHRGARPVVAQAWGVAVAPPLVEVGQAQQASPQYCSLVELPESERSF